MGPSLPPAPHKVRDSAPPTASGPCGDITMQNFAGIPGAPTAIASTSIVSATEQSPEYCKVTGVIAHVLTFAAHRRTLVALALGRHGVDELGWGDPMLWVAQPA